MAWSQEDRSADVYEAGERCMSCDVKMTLVISIDRTHKHLYSTDFNKSLEA